VLTRIDEGSGGHTVIINRLVLFSDGSAVLTYMNPRTSAPPISVMTFDYYNQLRAEPDFVQRIYSIKGMLY
jgi:hypothetical protein